MKTSVKATLIAITVAIVLLIVGIVFAISQGATSPKGADGGAQQTVGPDHGSAVPRPE